LLLGVEVAAELGGTRLAGLALGGERIPFGSAGAAAGFESVAPLDFVPVEEDEDEEDGDEDADEDEGEDIGAWSGRGWATSGE
jgi:hypothetical protein